LGSRRQAFGVGLLSPGVEFSTFLITTLTCRSFSVISVSSVVRISCLKSGASAKSRAERRTPLLVVID
jgi:hypothetical protein